MKSKKKAKIWIEYFIELLNILANPVEKKLYKRAESSLSDKTQEKTE